MWTLWKTAKSAVSHSAHIDHLFLGEEKKNKDYRRNPPSTKSDQVQYLRKTPKLVFDYIDYHKVKLWEAYLKEVAKDPDLAKRLGKERVAEMRQEHDAARPRFLNKNKDLITSWCRVSIRQRADDVGLGEFYTKFYAQASGMTHLDMSGLLAQADPNKVDVEVAPSETYVGPSLAMAFNMTFRSLADLNAEANLKYGDELTAVQDFYVAEMKKKR